MKAKVGVLFVQAQEGFGADSAIHAHLMRHLDRERFEVHVACTNGSGGGDPDSLRILREIPNLRVRPTQFAPSLGGASFSNAARVARAVRAFPRDLLDLRRYVSANKIRIVHGSDRPRDAVYGVALGRITGAKSIVHVHVKWSSEYGAPARWAVQNADAVLGISRYVSGTVVDMGRSPDRIYTVLNAIDASRWDPNVDGQAVRRELGLSPNVPLLAAVSRLFSWKGHRELLQAFAKARVEVPELKLVIVGADASHLQGRSFTEELRELARSLDVAEHVIFTGARTDVDRVMAACDVFTLPSFEEPFGLVFLEAMAMRRPVVAIDNGGTPEVIEHGHSGLLSPPWDIAALAANIVKLARDPELRQRMGDHGRQRVLAQFDAPRLARDTAATYERVLGL